MSYFFYIQLRNEYFIGYSESKNDEIIKMIDFYKNNNYKDIVGQKLGIVNEDNNEIIKFEPFFELKNCFEPIWSKAELNLIFFLKKVEKSLILLIFELL